VQPPSYAVTLVAAPALAGATRPAPEARSEPVTPVAPKTSSKPLPSSSRSPASKSSTRKATPVAPLPGETPGTGSDLANVDLKGKAFPYPEYLRNLVAQIYRRWNRPVGNASLSTEIAFVILRDGTVRDISVVSSSRSYSFDLEARGAIDQAAQVKAFGPLPAGYPADYLQINFTFAPRVP
jgi:protein TonB